MRPLAQATILSSALFVAAAAASAQTKAPAASAPAAAPPAAVSPDPTVTTAAFGDWTLRCEKQAGDKGQRICEAVQTVQLQNQQAPIAQIAFGHAAQAEPVKLVVVLPTNVSFPSSVKVGVGDKDPQSIDLAWRRCLPVGCFAENTAPDEAAKRWRNETGQGRITFKDATGRDAVLPISFRGLAQALDALSKQ